SKAKAEMRYHSQRLSGFIPGIPERPPLYLLVNRTSETFPKESSQATHETAVCMQVLCKMPAEAIELASSLPPHMCPTMGDTS
ncbi:mCG1037632, partial [Mus musculus]